MYSIQRYQSNSCISFLFEYLKIKFSHLLWHTKNKYQYDVYRIMTPNINSLIIWITRMLDTIKKTLYEKHKPEDKKWIFISIFDINGHIIASQWSLSTDLPLENYLQQIYHQFFEQHAHITKTIVIDIVQSIIEETDIKNILSLPTKEYGICIVNTETQQSGVILPNTKDVNDVKTALNLIKKKYGISGNVQMYSFRTERITVEL